VPLPHRPDSADGSSGAATATLNHVGLSQGLRTRPSIHRTRPNPAGCGLRLSFRSGDVDPFASAGTTSQGTKVPALAATNRGAVVEKPEPMHTILPSERLRMGIAHVRIGDDTLDWGTPHRLSSSDDPGERPIVQLKGLEQIASRGPNDAVAGSPDAQGESQEPLRQRPRLAQIQCAEGHLVLDFPARLQRACAALVRTHRARRAGLGATLTGGACG
jgi:hypothetical protein